MTEIRFSRHAKRRMQPYDISQDVVIGILPLADAEGRHTVTRRSPGHKFPIKVVYKVHAQGTVVITTYPVKKAKP